MRKAPAAAAKPKPRARAKASPDSLLSGASSPSGASDGSPSPSPVGLGRGLLSASKPKPRARAMAKPKGKPSPDSPSPSASSGSPSPVAVGRGGFLSPSSPAATPETRPPLTAAPMSTPASVSTVGDLRGLAASSLDSLKCRLDALYLEASHSRISKRITMQTQSCLQMAEEAEKEHKKMVDKYSHQADEMKVTFPEMAKSVTRAIDGLRSRYNIPATTA